MVYEACRQNEDCTVGMQMLTQVFGPQSWGTLANYNKQTCSTPDTGKLFHNMAIGIWLRWVIIQELTPFLSTSTSMINS